MSMNNAKRRGRGQTTVEYLLLLLVGVGQILVVGQLMRAFLPPLFDQLAYLIGGATPSQTAESDSSQSDSGKPNSGDSKGAGGL